MNLIVGYILWLKFCDKGKLLGVGKNQFLEVIVENSTFILNVMRTCWRVLGRRIGWNDKKISWMLCGQWTAERGNSRIRITN